MSDAEEREQRSRESSDELVQDGEVMVMLKDLIVVFRKDEIDKLKHRQDQYHSIYE